MEQTQLLTAEDVAEMLGFTSRTIRLMAQRGDIPGAKLGKEWRFDPDAIRAWIASRSIRPDQTAR